jgi:hypothetical protein
MKPSQAIRFGIAAIVLVLLLAACMHPSDSGSSASGSPSGSSTSESTTSPAIEQTTGLESPQSPTNDNPSISMPSVPAGNDGSDTSCVRANWLGNPIPPGDIVTITSVKVEKPFTFDPAATANCGSPSCVNYQFSAANDSGPFCYIGVGNENGPVSNDGDDTPGHMTLVGHLKCPPKVSSASCQLDAAAMQSGRGGRFEFDLGVIYKTPPASSSSESTTSSPPVSPPTSPATSDSSPVAPGSP